MYSRSYKNLQKGKTKSDWPNRRKLVAESIIT